MLEEAIHADVGLVRAWKGDRHGNLVFRSAARNFNPLAAMAGAVDDRRGRAPGRARRAGPRQRPPARGVRPAGGRADPGAGRGQADRERRCVRCSMKVAMALTREQMAARAAAELQDGDYVNLGIGLPTLVPDYVPDDVEIVLQSENGLLGFGALPARGRRGRGPDQRRQGDRDPAQGRVDLRLGHQLRDDPRRQGRRRDPGAMQVSAAGDIANWMIPGKMVKGMGGAMDLVHGAKKVIVLMEHVAKDGSHKIVQECTLPFTGKGVVQRIITDLAVVDVTPDGLVLRELAEGVTLEEVRDKTGPELADGRPPRGASGPAAATTPSCRSSATRRSRRCRRTGTTRSSPCASTASRSGRSSPSQSPGPTSCGHRAPAGADHRGDAEPAGAVAGVHHEPRRTRRVPRGPARRRRPSRRARSATADPVPADADHAGGPHGAGRRPEKSRRSRRPRSGGPSRSREPSPSQSEGDSRVSMPDPSGADHPGAEPAARAVRRGTGRARRPSGAGPPGPGARRRPSRPRRSPGRPSASRVPATERPATPPVPSAR